MRLRLVAAAIVGLVLCIDCFGPLNSEAQVLEQIQFMGSMYFRVGSARVDNAAKMTLDTVAVRMQQDPTYQLVLDGHSRAGETKGISLTRAKRVSIYLYAEKGVDLQRMVLRSFEDTCPAADDGENSRVDAYIVPEGHQPEDIDSICKPLTSMRPQ